MKAKVVSLKISTKLTNYLEWSIKWKRKYSFTKLRIKWGGESLKIIKILKSIRKYTKTLCQGFPGGAVVENLPANGGDAGSSPGLGRSHMPQSNSAREPQLLSLRVWSLCSATRGRDSERPPHRDEEWPPLATTRESPRTETKTQHSHTYIHTYIHKKNVSRQE